MTYDNTFFGPIDDNNVNQSPIYQGAAALYEQTCGGTYFSYSKKSGATGVCKNDDFYKLMRKYKFTESPWKEAIPELSKYNANPSNSKKPRCASDPSCPLAAWDQTVVCNAAIGSDRAFANKVVWPTDSWSQSSGDAKGGKNVPFRHDALVERGNKAGSSFAEDSVAVVGAIEEQGVEAVID
jgi:hypothetical protein